VSALKILQANLKRLRQARGWTQQEVAEKSGLEYKYYQRVEAGHWPGLQLRTVDKLAKAFKVEVAELFKH